MPVSQMNLAPGGPRVSRLALGLWRLAEWDFSDSQTLDLIESSLDLGITTFDHADIYGDYACERLFGRALALKPSLRERIQLVTKCGIKLVSGQRPEHGFKHYDTSRAHIVASAENSLKMLRTDRIDLLLIHRPDPLMDADEIAAAFGQLRESGKVLHFGVSNFTPWQLDLLTSRLDFPLVTNQVELSVLFMDLLHDGTVDQCQRLRISPMAWSPLARGELFYHESERAERVRVALRDIAAEWDGAGVDQVALAWILRHPARVVPVLGSGKLDRITSAVGAERISLTREQWFRIWAASAGTDVP